MSCVISYKLKKYHEIASAEYKKAKTLLENGLITKDTFKENFRGIIAIKHSLAYNNIQKLYKEWLDNHEQETLCSQVESLEIGQT